MTKVCRTSCSVRLELRERTDPAQVLLRWATQRGIAVIPKTNNNDRLRSNLDCTSFDLTEAEFDAINSLNADLRVRSAVR
jgi:D-xylose reductase